MGPANWFIVAVASVVTVPLHAQNVVHADVEYQPLLYSNDIGYTGCGIRGIVLADPAENKSEGADFSVNIYMSPDLFAAVKVSAITIDMEKPRSFSKQKTSTFAIATLKSGKSLRLDSVLVPGEDGLSMMARVDVTEAIDLVGALVIGERLTLR